MECDHSNYDRVCAELFATIGAGRGLAGPPSPDGPAAQAHAGRVSVRVFDEEWRVGGDGAYRGDRRLDTTGSILVARYVLNGGSDEIEGVWLPYGDLKGGLQFASFVRTHLEDKMALEFSGRRGVLEERMLALGASAYEGETSADLALVVRPLPMVPVLCLFRDKDEEFPASFRFLFDASAPAYLDLESLAVALQYIQSRVSEEA